MASGDTKWFAGYLQHVLSGTDHDFGASPNTVKCALIKGTVEDPINGIDPDVSAAFPTWGSYGTDYSVAEVAETGIYVAGGKECANVTLTRINNVVRLDWDNPAAWGQDGSNPDNARWAIFYDDTSTNKNCICFMDLGATRDMTAGELLVQMGAPALTGTAAT